MKRKNKICVSALLRHVLTAWLFAVTIEFLLIPTSLRKLGSVEALSQMSFLRVVTVTVCGLILLLLSYARKGWDETDKSLQKQISNRKGYLWFAVGCAIPFFLFVSVWTVCRVYSFGTPSYDFGIFSQMYYNMKESGFPMTTIERDGPLSHFCVHVSPIYY